MNTSRGRRRVGVVCSIVVAMVMTASAAGAAGEAPAVKPPSADPAPAVEAAPTTKTDELPDAGTAPEGAVDPGNIRVPAKPASIEPVAGAEVVGPDDPDGAKVIDAAAPAATAAPDPEVGVTDLRTARPSEASVNALLAEARANGEVQVIVRLRTLTRPEGSLDPASARTQRAEVARLQTQVIDVARAKGGTVVRQFEFNPAVAVRLTPAALNALRNHPAVADIQVDAINYPTLDESTPLIGASDLHDRGFSGSGWSVAVIDTGVERNHPFIGGGVVAEACFSQSACPDGSSSQTGTGAAAPCTYNNGRCSHGTHVAGIATGVPTAARNMSGVARGSLVLAVRAVTPRTGGTCPSGQTCPVMFDSDMIAGLDWVFGLRNSRSIGAVNISFGGGSFAGFCDTSSIKPSIDNLRSVAIPTVVSSGNDGFSNGVISPACISSAVTVGATTITDTVPNFSNSGPQVDFFAPGVAIDSSIMNGQYASWDGTSMAAPHVAGAWALLRQRFPNESVTTIYARLLNTGKMVTDGAASPPLTRPRIDVLKASGLDVIDLNVQTQRNLRPPVPNSHQFTQSTSRNYWSVVAIRPPAGADYDMRLRLGTYTGTTVATSTASGSVVDFVAIDTNRAPTATRAPEVYRFGGTSDRYTVEFDDPGRVLSNGQTAGSMGGRAAQVWDTFESSGTTTSYRVVPTNGADVDAFVMASDAGNTATYFRGRGQAAGASASGGPGVAEVVHHPSSVSQWNALVVTSSSPSATFTVYRDTSSPVLSSVTLAGGAASTATATVPLALSASDPETGLWQMRVSTDGTLDTESWVPYAASGSVTLPGGAGVKTVRVQVSNGAGQLSTVLSDTIQLTGGGGGTPAARINDVAIVEGNSGTKQLVFTVTLSAPAPAAGATVKWRTIAGTATAGSDFVAVPLTMLSFASGQTTRTVSVTIKGDRVVEPNETFTVQLSAPVRMTIADNTGVGTITRDD